jgi:chromate transporter
MHIGNERAGWKGLVIAGFCFLLPAVCITVIFAWAYRRYGELPEVGPFIYGIKPAIISVITVTMLVLGRKALKTVQLGIIGTLSAMAVLAGVNEIVVLFSAGLIGIFLYLLRSENRAYGIYPFVMLQINLASPDISSLKLFFIFLKVGAILYGSGYVLFAFLDAELVAKGLLTKQQLIDAIAVGQFTPGPVFSSATFIGWQIGGFAGAIAATIGIFLPSFIFVALLNPVIPKLRRSKIMAAFLDTINIASIGIILSVVVEMGKETLLDWKMILIAVISFIVTYYIRTLNTAFVIFGGAVIGYALSYI